MRGGGGLYSINMPNTQQNDEIEHINKEINLLQDRLKKNEKCLSQFQNGLMKIERIRVKKRTKDETFSNRKNTKCS